MADATSCTLGGSSGSVGGTTKSLFSGGRMGILSRSSYGVARTHNKRSHAVAPRNVSPLGFTGCTLCTTEACMFRNLIEELG